MSTDWLEQWLRDQCNGDWEHSAGIRISTLDNPGWLIEIDLNGTSYESITIPMQIVEIDDSNWYNFRIEKGHFLALGDSRKLGFLLNLFKDVVEKFDASTL